MRHLPLAVLLVLATACGKGPEEPRIAFSDVETAAAEPHRSVKPLRIAIASIVSPQRNLRDYERMLQYLGRKLGMPVEVVQRSGYSECITLLENREIDAAFVCSGPYVDARERFGAEALVVPRVSGRGTYCAYVIARKGGPIRAFEDLRGKVFAFTDPLSTTGKLYPSYRLAELRQTAEAFFGRTIFTGGHDNSVEAVAHGLADGAAVSSLVWEGMAKSGVSAASQTKVIERSLPFGMPPVVVHPRLDPALKARLRDVFLNMHRDPEGRALLAQAGIERFTATKDSAYDGVRRIRAAVTEAR
ncbi:MAG: phosphate/phosphite/phosphonate ABC transporter substrate-binding protein [Elusimicrobia bacterium]|nr:phosphate/phosphite/phosphonate ABC transporter substrate-binding protein [Elusimicrobiota bacterium]